MKLTHKELNAILDAAKKDYVWRAGDEYRVTRDPVNDVALLLDHVTAMDARLAAADKLAETVERYVHGPWGQVLLSGDAENLLAAAKDCREAGKP